MYSYGSEVSSMRYSLPSHAHQPRRCEQGPRLGQTINKRDRGDEAAGDGEREREREMGRTLHCTESAMQSGA